MSLTKMLVPVALEPRDEKLIAYACGLLAQGVCELLVVNVVDSSGQEAPVIMHEVERARERLREIVEPYTDCGMQIEQRVVTGSVYREVMALAHQVNVDVICCATEGKSFVDYLFSGSVSEDLALKGNERTMTVRWDLLMSAPDAGQVSRDFAKRLVVPTDFSASALRAVLSAYERPAEALGVVYLVHVVSDPSDRSEAEVQMRALTALAEEYGATVETVLLEGNPSEAVLDYIREIDATGVITGRQGRSRLGRGILGSVSMKLLQEAPCPVVIQP